VKALGNKKRDLLQRQLSFQQ